MIILDTNVISACMKSGKNSAVMNWLNQQPPESVWTTVITIYELRYGVETILAPDHKRRLEETLEAALIAIFDGRILVFDFAAAQEAAKLAAERRLRNRSVEIRDTQIAGIVRARKAMLATRNTRDFVDAGIPLVDPWTAGA